MASTFALPATAVPHDHHHDSEPHHSHSHSSQLSQDSASRARPRGHSHSRNRASDTNMSQYKANSTQPIHGRSNSNVPPPLVPNGHWRMDSTPGGRPLITPTAEAFDVKSNYEAPDHAVSVHVHHEHAGPRSAFTKFLLPYTARWPLVHAIMAETDSRRIFYFMTLNFAFMTVQAFYGYATDSLGLLSDSIHMFFDCVALAVGLFAAVASKWPPSQRFPYGFGKIETLSGFGNGVFLILISVEIMFEAVERIMEGRETKRLGELFVVSTMGLLVNLVGMMAFGHHHHGHDHGHGHSHGHDHGHAHAHEHNHSDHDGHAHDHDHHHDHSHGHDHSHDYGHSHDHGHDHGHNHSHDHGHSHAGHSHGHSHDNENMYGIYLHVLADTLGSAAVIVSTILTHFWGWSGWDPLASFLIAVLILLSALPLVKSSARRLLLTIPDDVEYTLRDTLSGISGLRGVAGYSVPKFWLDDRNAGAGPKKLLGVMHVLAGRGADLDDVRERVLAYLLDHAVDVVLQVEREGDASCWCGLGRSPLAMHQMSQSKNRL